MIKITYFFYLANELHSKNKNSQIKNYPLSIGSQFLKYQYSKENYKNIYISFILANKCLKENKNFDKFYLKF